MIMSDLHLPDYPPVYPVAKKVKPRQRRAKLPNWGIEQSATVGQNQTSPEWDVRWVLYPIEANTLDAFLAERAKNGEWFLWTPPGRTQGRFRCDNWTKTLPNCTAWEVQAAFRQVFSFNLPSLGASTGYFALTGFRVAPIPAILRPNTVSFALSGSSAALAKGYLALTDFGTFALTGSAIEAQRGYLVDAATGVLLLTGRSAIISIPGSGFEITPPTFALSTTPSGTTLSAVGLSTSNSSATLQVLVSPVDFL